jgi:transposase
MPKHKSEDYKLSAVRYYLNNDISLDNVCKIFNCSKQSLYRWFERYQITENIQRQNKKSISYKITKEQVIYAINLLKENEQITNNELIKLIKKKYKNFDITPQHLGEVIRDNNITRKRTKHEHYPK